MLYEIKVPEAGFSVKEAVIVQWHKKIGQKIQEGEVAVTVETDKVTVEIPTLATGVLVEIRFKKGESAPIGAVLGIIAEERDAAAMGIKESASKMAEQAPVAAVSGEAREKEPGFLPGGVSTGVAATERRKISPLARKIAEEEGIDLSQIPVGTGPGGRVTKEDVLDLVSKRRAAQGERRDISQAPEDAEKIRFVGWRKVIADRMISSARNVPQGRTIMEVDVTDLAKFIKSMKERREGPRITYLPFLMKAIQAGVEVSPEVNAYCYDDGFVLKKELNIGVAVDVGEKLVVPVVKRVHDKSILRLAEDIQELAHKARTDALKPEDVQGGTMTITNLGPYDVYAAEPLILQPQTTIIAMGTVREQPWVTDGSIEMRKKVMITGVFDHRAVNGAPGARFLKRIKDHLEDINNLLLMLR